MRNNLVEEIETALDRDWCASDVTIEDLHHLTKVLIPNLIQQCIENSMAEVNFTLLVESLKFVIGKEDANYATEIESLIRRYDVQP